MKLSQATSYFNDVPLEGWNGTAWYSLGVSCNLLSYDRFVGPRVFGHKQRIMLVGQDNLIPAGVEFVRMENQITYLVLSLNEDIDIEGIYGTTYIVQTAIHTVEVIEQVTTPAPSGIGGSIAENTVLTTFCDLERYTSESSTELDSIRYGVFSILMPASALPNLKTDNLLIIDGEYYNISEVNPHLNVYDVRAMKQGSNQ